MTSHKTGTREEWLAARLELLRGRKSADAAHRRRGAAAPGAALGQHRQAVPVRHRRGAGVARRPVPRALAASRLPLHVRARLHRRVPVLFGDRRRVQRLGRPPRQSRRHADRGVAGPLAKIQAYKRRMGWSFPFASSYGSDFNYDFQVGHTEEAWDAGAVEYNFRVTDLRPPAGEESSRTPGPRRSSARTGKPTGAKGPG